jgi:hypothetical protein
MPQLASGEFGWAIDAQELYIGNGSVAEGAPAVGNTRILTEKDFSNVLDFAKLYAYQPNETQTGLTPGTTFFRSLQDRLDDSVSVKAFGAVGDGLADDTVPIQNAIDQLFLDNAGSSADIRKRKILFFPPGTYKISSTIHLPPYAILLGSGRGNTVITSDTVTIFDTVTSNSVSGDYDYSLSINTNLVPPAVEADPLPKYIYVSNMSIETLGEVPGIFLRNCFDSRFENLKITGSWSVILNTEVADNIGIKMSSDYLDVTARNDFVNVEISNFTYGVYSDYDVRDNLILNSSIKNCMSGVVFGQGTASIPELEDIVPTYGPRFNKISNCVFDRISRYGIRVTTGDYNTSDSNKFYNVGNDQGEFYLGVFPAISFETETNTSSNDFFERAHYNFNAVNNLNADYIPDISGPGRFAINQINSLSIGENVIGLGTSADVLKLPAPINGKVYIDYTLSGVYLADGEFCRTGTIEIFVGVDQNILINDAYDYTGSTFFANSFIFDAELRDLGPQPTTSGYTDYQTLILKVSEIPPLTNDNFSYTIRLKS